MYRNDLLVKHILSENIELFTAVSAKPITLKTASTSIMN